MASLRFTALCWLPFSLLACAAAPATGSGGGSSASSGSPTSVGAGGSGDDAGSDGAPGPCTAATDCAAMNDPCNVGACVNGTCVKAPANEHGACDDGLFCTDNDSCVNGVCVGGNAKSCAPPDACHIGICDEATDSCSSMAGNDGAQCDDMDSCTLAGTCNGGTCLKGPPVDCSVLNGICSVGTCVAGQGCIAMPVNDGTSCDDGLYCTVNDHCKAGQCSGDPNPCGAPADPCMIANCNEQTHTCVASPGNDGTPCDDKNLCTSGETCTAGKCGGGAPANNGVACDDANGCTAGTTCSGGQCTNAVSQIVMCASNDQCCPAGCSIGNDNDCAFAFKATQVIDGVTVNCSNVINNVMYTECDDLKANGLYFPNGVLCGDFWSMQASPYTDLGGFCQSLTNTPKAEAYYTCDFSQARSTWKAHVWGTTMDNGYTQHLRCYY